MTNRSVPPLGPYPASRRDDVREERFGETVDDPWRWLEADVRSDSEVADWVDRQAAFTDAWLAALPGRAAFARVMEGLVDFERTGLPERRGAYLFYRWNAGLMNQSQLLVEDAAGDEAGDVAGGESGDGHGRRVLLDPNGWARDGATALDAWEPSPGGSVVAYTVQDGGSDWRSIGFVRSSDGTVLADRLDWVKFSGLSWVDEQHLLYSRFPEPAEGEAFQALNYDQGLWLHRLGTAQAQDRLIFATPDHPGRMHTGGVSSDGRWLIISSSEGTDPVNAVHIAEIDEGIIGPVRPLIDNLDAQWDFIDSDGDRLLFVTGEGAPRKKIVAIEPAATPSRFHTLVAQGDDILQWARIVGDRLVAVSLRDACARLLLFTREGEPLGEIALPGPGSVDGITGRPGDAAGYVQFTSFCQPATVLAFDPAGATCRTWRGRKLPFEPSDFRVEQVFFASKDGTRVPMFVIRRKDREGPLPTILYGYGGFNVSLTPWFSAAAMAWLDCGGAYAVANLRGGGEYGDGWHDAGRRERKQNVFDDFIAAAQWLIDHAITPRDGLAIAGGSNGGLLVGAVVNQRPDLFAAASPAVGVMDMLRFDRFTAGRFWVDDYGYPEREADWKVLRAYSPYHNIPESGEYPAILVTTADTDDRVVPGHSFKYLAALQAADLGPRPRLIRIERRAGHGAGKPIAKVIAETADVHAFLGFWTGLELGAE